MTCFFPSFPTLLLAPRGLCVACTEEDAKTIKADPFYQCPYSDADIQRVSSLPTEFGAAFSQLKTANDFRLHYLLSKFTFGEVRAVLTLLCCLLTLVSA